MKTLLAAILLIVSICPVGATTKGLNQIITPDIQPVGVLSISYQQQSRAIANPHELQLEFGLSKRTEVAVFRGLSPGEVIGGAEYGIIQRPHFLVSTGFANWNSHGIRAQGFLEAGYYGRKNKFVLGAIRVADRTQAILGWQVQTPCPRVQLQADYQSGSDNYFTTGFTYAVSPDLSLNPSVYWSNSRPHKAYYYAVLSWNVTVCKERH